MSDLRDLVSNLGHTNVRTLLNNGNVLFQNRRPNVAKLSSSIEAAIAANCGFSAMVTVITAEELAFIIDENPLLKVATDPSRHLVAFASHPKLLAPLRPMLKETWSPDALAITSRAAYLWCSTGILDSKLSLAFARKAGASATTRNWATVLKLQAAAQG
ncbi:MAG: DUF1697 domain-containing protein [Pseudomonadota bacterium]|nr:DUF1697 domain-containing protein [Pseudomonadota bacterium]